MLMLMLLRFWPLLVCLGIVVAVRAGGESDRTSNLLPGFEPSPWFDEQVREEHTPSGVRLLFNAPAPTHFDPARATLVLFYATPNGNSIEQTLGSAMVEGTDWHFDIQHIAAQTRRLREVDTRENIVLVCVEADGHSWPAWRQKHPDSAAQIRGLVETAARRIPGTPVRLALAGHSGGGSFLFGYLDSVEAIPATVERIVFLDANYSYSDAARHGEKLRTWLDGALERRLVVIAYDDRNITLNGKPVVKPDGGTYRATHRMLDAWAIRAPLRPSSTSAFEDYQGSHGQAIFRIHRNPENKILHTALVGEMNGLLYALTQGTPEETKWGTFGGPRAYTAWVQPAAIPTGPLPAGVIPPRAPDAPGGTAFMTRIAYLPPAEREAALLHEILQGNLPDFLRQFKTITTSAVDDHGAHHTVTYTVMPDYLAVGSDRDFVRVPITPMTAQQIADRFGCVLPTRKMVDDIYRHAELKLEPRPLTQDREAVKTFLQHNSIIEAQRQGKPLGLLVAGIKKDLVVTNRLREQPHRVAIYGWHLLDGKPIQPLTIVHRDTYVDYSHGARLVAQTLQVDGKPAKIGDVLKDPQLSLLLSDEGVIDAASVVSN